MHGSLAHDLLDQDDAGVALSSDVLALLLADDLAVIVPELVSDGLDDVVLALVSGERAGARHAGLSCDDGMAADDDVPGISAAGMSEVHLLIEVALGGAELVNLHAVLVDTGQHEHDAVSNLRDALAELTLYLRCNRAHIHDGVCVDMSLVGIDDIKSQALAERILLHGPVDDAAVDRNPAVLNGGLGADLDVRDFDVLLDKSADDLLLTLLCRRGLRERLALSHCRSGGSASERDVQCQVFNPVCLSDVDVQHTVSFRGCRDGRCRGRFLCRGLCLCRCFLGCRSILVDLVQNVLRDGGQGLHILKERGSQNLADPESVRGEG